MRKRTLIPLSIASAVIVALGIAVVIRKEAPPEAARLLPESDAIVYVRLKEVRSLTHFDRNPVARSPALQTFIDATGIVPERDIDSAAFALHRVPVAATRYEPAHAELYMSEVFVGRFDGERLLHYLDSTASSRETYAGRTVYSIPMGDQTLRVAMLGYDTIAASNMPTSEQIHSMLDRSRASALATPGCSLLSARYHDVPLLAEAWAIGHIGLPFSQNGQIAVLGTTLPLPEDSDLVASLSYLGTEHLLAGGSVRLRVEQFAPDPTAAQHTTDSLNTLLSLLRGIDLTPPGSAQPDSSDAAIRSILAGTKLQQHDDRAVLESTATVEQLKAIFAAHDPAAAGAPTASATPATSPASK
jgi:hypothetical protein